MNVLIAKFDKPLSEKDALMGAFNENYPVAINLITEDAIIPHKPVQDNLADKLAE